MSEKDPYGKPPAKREHDLRHSSDDKKPSTRTKDTAGNNKKLHAKTPHDDPDDVKMGSRYTPNLAPLPSNNKNNSDYARGQDDDPKYDANQGIDEKKSAAEQKLQAVPEGRRHQEQGRSVARFSKGATVATAAGASVAAVGAAESHTCPGAYRQRGISYQGEKDDETSTDVQGFTAKEDNEPPEFRAVVDHAVVANVSASEVESEEPQDIEMDNETIDEPDANETIDVADANQTTLEAFIAPERREVVEAGGVAVVMSEQEEEEYERYKYRRLRRIGCVAMVVIIVAVVVPTVLLVGGGNEVAPTAMPSLAPSAMPSLAPTSEKFDRYLDYLVPISGAGVLDNRNSPQYRAASWAAEDDPITPELPIGSEQLDQRYALATFYFALNGDDWTFKNDWLTEVQECKWFGIRCDDNGKVNRLFFESRLGNNMRGELPPEITLMQEINTIYIQENYLRGTLPIFLNEFTNLNSLLVHGNEFTGTIAPETFSRLNKLTRLLVGKNPMLGGPIPETLAELPILSDIRMEDSNFTGMIPTVLGGMSALEILELQNNRLGGTVPTELYSLSNMTRLRLDDNELVGSIPTLIGQLTKLSQLGLNATGFGGDLPTELFSLTTMQRLFLNNAGFSGNLLGGFSGNLTVNFANLNLMEKLHLNNNTFSGPVPTEFDLLTDLRELFLHGNDLTGTISQALCARKGPTLLAKLTTDCGGSDPEVACACCEPCYVDG